MTDTRQTAPMTERDFWMQIRQGLRMMESAIGKRYGFEDPCCKELDRVLHSRSKTPCPGESWSVNR